MRDVYQSGRRVADAGRKPNEPGRAQRCSDFTGGQWKPGSSHRSRDVTSGQREPSSPRGNKRPRQRQSSAQRLAWRECQRLGCSDQPGRYRNPVRLARDGRCRKRLAAGHRRYVLAARDDGRRH